MPSLSSLANTAANGWRKFKEEALTYTPPSSEGAKPLRSPDRKLRKMSIIQYTDLPRPNIKSKTTSREIQLGLPQSYIRQCETDRFFRDNHKHYYSEDSILGLVFISIALDTSTTPTTAHGHVFTKCGPLSIPPLRVSADSSCYSAVYHLTEDARGSLPKQAAAMLLLKYFANTPGLVMEEARRNVEGGGWGGLGGVCAFDEMHAADIAERCERLKGNDINLDIKCAMEWRGYNRIFVDVVIPNENEIEDHDGIIPTELSDLGLSSFLSLFTTSMPLKETKALPAIPTKKPQPIDEDPASRRTHILEELQSTERHFLVRMHHLLQDYHAPLKTRAKSSDPILNMYQVNTIFPRSLEVIVKAHETFYAALESADQNDVPKVLLEHFEHFKECYPRFLEGRRGSTEMLKEQLQNTIFREFVDKQKYHGGLQIGLAELLIDPVQRIPRYSLFINDLLPVFPSEDLMQALNIVKEIGQMERRIEDRTSDTWARLKRLIKDLPADLISSSRVLLDAVDCVEILPPYSSGVSGLQATVCLFSDCIMFVKRAWMEQSLSTRLLSEDEDLAFQVGIKQEITGQSQVSASFRGSISLDKIRISKSDTAIWITLLEEMDGKVVQGKWTGRTERRFVPCTKQSDQIARFMGKLAEAKRMARGKCEAFGTTEREGGKLTIDWGIMRREQYDEIKQKADIAVFYAEKDTQVAMPYLQSIGAPVVSLSVSCQKGQFRLYEDNMLDVPPTAAGETVYSEKTIADRLFHQIIDSERVLTAPYAPLNLNTYLISNTQLLSVIHRKSLPPSLPKALASLPSSPTKSISSLFGSPKRRHKDSIDTVRTSAFDSPSTGSQSQASDATSRTTTSSIEDGVIVNKRQSTMFLGPETKEKGFVAGVRSFVEGLRDKEWQNVEGDLNSLSLNYQRQVLELVALIDKYPTRTFAVCGSSAEIAYPAFTTFMKEKVEKKLGMLISTDVASRLHIINDMPVAEDLKRARFGDALKELTTEKVQVVRLLVILLSDGPKDLSKELAEKSLHAIAKLLVTDSSAKDFIPVLHCMVQAPSMVFEFLEQNEPKFLLRGSSQATYSTFSKSSTRSRLTPSPTKSTRRMSLTSQNTFGTRSSMSSMSFQRTQSMRRPMSGTMSNRPISSGVGARRPVTAIDFGEPLQASLSVKSRASVPSMDDDWFIEHNETSVCLVLGSEEESEGEATEVEKKKSEETLRDMVLTANEYFNRSSKEGGNWWE